MSPRTLTIAAAIATLITGGCAASADAHHGGPTSQPDSAGAGTLAVRIAVYGGPARADGSMAMNGEPAQQQPVQLRDQRGRVWPGNTGPTGIAVFTVPAGTYRVSSSYCGIPTSVRLAAGASHAVALQCDVP